MSANLNTLDLVLNLLRVLSHKVRTPLSVISNDLSYLQTLLKEDECERSIQRCRQISDFFKPAQLLQSTDDDSTEVATLLAEVFLTRLRIERDFICRIKRGNLKQAFIWIDQLFKVLSVKITSSKEIFFETGNNFDYNSEQPDLSSVFDIFSSNAGDESIIPLLVDAVFLSSEIKVFRYNSHIFYLSFP